MPLIDYQNNVIYWDEVNWKWLPFLRIEKSGNCYLVKDKERFPINCEEDIVNLLKSFGFCLLPLMTLGITEVSLGSFLYNGKLYSLSSTKRSILVLISLISGKPLRTVKRNFKGISELTKSIFEELLSTNSLEYKGRVYKSIHSLAIDLGIPYNYIHKYISKGMSVEDIVKMYNSRGVSDHLGNQFDSITSMCTYWNISRNVYQGRSNMGWSLEKILTTPVKKNTIVKECVDFKGNVFPSIRCMAETYGVPQSSIRYHVKRGKSPGEALKCLLDEKPKVKDHLGNTFSTVNKMAEYWGINGMLYRNRRSRGWSLEEALTGKRSK